jgi:hypothetical protein
MLAEGIKPLTVFQLNATRSGKGFTDPGASISEVNVSDTEIVFCGGDVDPNDRSHDS